MCMGAMGKCICVWVLWISVYVYGCCGYVYMCMGAVGMHTFLQAVFCVTTFTTRACSLRTWFLCLSVP